ncbi:hypothetical protein [Providencia sp. Me31A]|uniref:hypothetical protein n=1 Tax=Providencia sp. Me31A TaxID=3392637 RepID=UPI003D29F403
MAGLIKQIYEPTGDGIVILVLGLVVCLFFMLTFLLGYSVMMVKQKDKRLLWSKVQRNIGILFLLYPFVGFLASIFLIKAGNLGIRGSIN